MQPTPPRTPGPVLIEAHDITKRFGGAVALDRVSLSVHAGEVHGLVGENGAGKSTLMRILAGVLTPDAGVVEVDDDTRRRVATVMLDHARELLQRVGYGTPRGPEVELGIGLDFGEAFIGIDAAKARNGRHCRQGA